MTAIRMTVTATAALLAMARPAFADADAELRALSEAYVRHPVMQQMLDGVWSDDTVRSIIATSAQAYLQSLGDEEIETLARIFQEEIERIRPRWETMVVDAIAQTYELDELQAFMDFLDSDAGTRAMLKTGKMQEVFYNIAGFLLQELTERVTARFETEILK